MSTEDKTKELPLWARLRIAHDFADDDEKKELETLAKDIIDKHPDIQKIACYLSIQGGKSGVHPCYFLECGLSVMQPCFICMNSNTCMFCGTSTVLIPISGGTIEPEEKKEEKKK